MTRERRAGLLAALSVAAVAFALSAMMTDGTTRITFIVGALVCIAATGGVIGAGWGSPDEPNLD